MAKVTRVKDAFTPSLGDVFPDFKPKKKVQTQKSKRYSRKDKTGLNRFSPGTRVRCWWPKAIDSPLNGKIGIVCTKKDFDSRKKYVVIPKAEKQTRTVPDEVAFQVTEMVDRKVEEGHDCWFLTEDEYTIISVMES